MFKTDAAHQYEHNTFGLGSIIVFMEINQVVLYTWRSWIVKVRVSISLSRLITALLLSSLSLWILSRSSSSCHLKHQTRIMLVTSMTMMTMMTILIIKDIHANDYSKK